MSKVLVVGILFLLSGCGYSLILGGGFVSDGTGYSQSQVLATPVPSPVVLGASHE